MQFKMRPVLRFVSTLALGLGVGLLLGYSHGYDRAVRAQVQLELARIGSDLAYLEVISSRAEAGDLEGVVSLAESVMNWKETEKELLVMYEKNEIGAD